MKNDRHIRTDLALELKEDISSDEEIKGVKLSTKVNEDSDIRETIIEVINEAGERELGKPKGIYITLESAKLRGSDEGIHEPMVNAIMESLKGLIKDDRRLLVIGLGNRDVTPDALGPLVAGNLYVTRHLINEGLVKNVRELSALSPGVMAQTGIESVDIIRALAKVLKPDCIIAVDALAAREPARLNSTIQICDTGISPGAGVGNNRMELNRETLGIKVIAIGVPTVISVPAIVNQSIDGMVEALTGIGHKISFSDEEKYKLACELVDNGLKSMFVTPKNVDESVKRVSYTISEAINRLL